MDQAFADAMTNLRKYGLRLVNAHQSQSQPPFDTPQGQAFLSTVKANSRIKVVFRLDRPDAETIAKELFAVTDPQVSHYSVDRTESYSEQRATNVAYSFSVTEGTAATWSRSRAISLGRTRTLGIGHTFGTNIGKTLTDGIGGSTAESLAKAITKSESEGVTEAYSQAKQISVAIGTNWAQIRDHRRGLTLTQGENGTFAVQQGLDRSMTRSEQHGETETEGRSSGTTDTQGETLTQGRNGNIAYYNDGRSRSTSGESSSTTGVRSAAASQGRSFSRAISTIRSAAQGLTEKSGMTASVGRKLDRAVNSSEGESSSDGGSRVRTEGTAISQTLGKSFERGRSETDTESRTETESWDRSVAHAFSLLEQVSKTYSEALQESRTDTDGFSLSERRDFGRSEQVGESESLGHSMGRTRRPVYYTLEEKRELAVNQLQRLGNRQCFVSTEALNTQLLETPYVPDQQYAYLAQDYPKLMLELQRVRFLGTGGRPEVASQTKTPELKQSEEEPAVPISPKNDRDPFLG